jgi:hypothetical protein
MWPASAREGLLQLRENRLLSGRHLAADPEEAAGRLRHAPGAAEDLAP